MTVCFAELGKPSSAKQTVISEVVEPYKKKGLLCSVLHEKDYGLVAWIKLHCKTKLHFPFLRSHRCTVVANPGGGGPGFFGVLGFFAKLAKLGVVRKSRRGLHFYVTPYPLPPVCIYVRSLTMVSAHHCGEILLLRYFKI
jgi:hypothetical protein